MLSLTTDAKAAVSVAFTDQVGLPVGAPAVPSYAIADAAVASVSVAEDGLSAEVSGLSVGKTVLSVAAGSFAQDVDVEVVAAVATAMVVTEGAAAAKG